VWVFVALDWRIADDAGYPDVRDLDLDSIQNSPLAARLAGFSDDRAIHNPDRPTDSSIEPMSEVFPKEFDTQQAQPLLAVAPAFEQATSEISVQFASLARTTVSRNE